jgi:hypothetical protein
VRLVEDVQVGRPCALARTQGVHRAHLGAVVGPVTPVVGLDHAVFDAGLVEGREVCSIRLMRATMKRDRFPLAEHSWTR